MSETSNLSRRAVLQGAGAGAAVLAGGALLPGVASAFPPAAPAATGLSSRPFGRHLAFGADPSRQVVVSWQSHSKVTGPYVRIGTSPDSLGAPIAAELRQLDSQLSWQNPAHDFPPNATWDPTPNTTTSSVTRATTPPPAAGSVRSPPSARPGAPGRSRSPLSATRAPGTTRSPPTAWWRTWLPHSTCHWATTATPS
jgi:hypothetical protein